MRMENGKFTKNERMTCHTQSLCRNEATGAMSSGNSTMSTVLAWRAEARKIGGHMRTVQSRISRVLTNDSRFIDPTPETKPVCDHLGRALDNGEQEKTQSFVRTIEKIAPELCWQYGYETMPRSLEHKYAYSEILGPKGPIVCDDLIVGLVLFAPKLYVSGPQPF